MSVREGKTPGAERCHAKYLNKVGLSRNQLAERKETTKRDPEEVKVLWKTP